LAWRERIDQDALGQVNDGCLGEVGSERGLVRSGGVKIIF
jgi:hypothetical protein